MGSLKHMSVMESHWVWDIVGTKLLPSLKVTIIFAPENGCLEYSFPFRTGYFQVHTVSFR